MDASSYASALQSAVMPAGNAIEPISIVFNAHSYCGNMLHMIAGSISKGEEDALSEAMLEAFFANACTLGLPCSESLSSSSVFQSIYSTSSAIIYVSNIVFYLKSMPSYINFLTHSINDMIDETTDQSNSKSAIAALNWMLKALSQTVASADSDIALLPLEMSVRCIKPSYDELLKPIDSLISSSEWLICNGHSSGEAAAIESDLVSAMRKIMTALPTFSQQMETISLKMSKKTRPLFTETAFSSFQKFLYALSNEAVDIVIVSIQTFSFNRENFSAVIPVLKHFADRVFSISSMMTSLMRFRGDFETTISSVSKCKASIEEIIRPLLSALVSVIHAAHQPFQTSAGKRIASLFSNFQKNIEQFDDRLSDLVDSLRRDRRFSIFQNFKSNNGSEVAMKAASLLNVLVATLKDPSKYNDKPIDSCFQSLMKCMGQTSQLKKAMNELQLCYSKLLSSHNNYLAAVPLIRSVASLDLTLINYISVLRAILNDNLIHFFPSKIKDLIHLVEDEKCNPLYGPLSSEISRVFSIFSSNDDNSNDNCIISCTKAIDRLSAYLDAFLEGSKNQPLRVLADSICRGPIEVRLSLQLHYIESTACFADSLERFLQILSSAASLQTDERYISVMQKKELMTSHISKIRNFCKKPPPFNVFDHSYLISLVKMTHELIILSQKSLLDAFEILKLSNAPSELKASMMAITRNLDAIIQMQPLISSLSFDISIVEKGILERFARSTALKAELSAGRLIDGIRTNKSFEAGADLIEKLFRTSDAADCLDSMKAISEPLRKEASKMFFACSAISNGDMSCIKEVASNFDEIVRILGELKAINPKEIKHQDKMEGIITENQVSEIFDKLMENETTKGIGSTLVDQLKELLRVAETSPESQDVAKPKIAQTLKSIEACLSFDPNTSKLSDVYAKFEATTEKTEMAALLSLSLTSTLLPSNLAAKSLIENAFKQSDISALNVISRCILENPISVEAELISKLMKELESDTESNIDNILKESIAADKLCRSVFSIAGETALPQIAKQTKAEALKLLSRIGTEVANYDSGNDIFKLRNNIRTGSKTDFVKDCLRIADVSIRKSTAYSESNTSNVNDELSQMLIEMSKFVNQESVLNHLDKFIHDPESASASPLLSCLISIVRASEEDNQSIKNILLMDSRSKLSHAISSLPRSDDLNALIIEIQRLFESFISACKVDESQIRKSAELISLLNNSIKNSMLKLPSSFILEAFIPEEEPIDIEIIRKSVQNSYNALSLASIEFVSSFNTDDIYEKISNFHKALNQTSKSINNLISAVWSPKSRSTLLSLKEKLVNIGEQSIAVAKTSRLSNNEGEVKKFSGDLSEFVNSIIPSTKLAIDSAEADLNLTNEAEKLLVNAAKSVAASQRRLDANENHDSGYAEMSDILGWAAELIEIAKQQTKWCLERNPELPNKNGLIKSASDLMESLSLLTSSVDDNKVIASCNMISGAIARFNAESNQKNGNPELNEAMKSASSSIESSVKNLRELVSRKASKKVTSQRTQGIQNLISKLNAESRISNAARDVENAEMRLKKVRQSASKDEVRNAEAELCKAKRTLEEAQAQVEN